MCISRGQRGRANGERGAFVFDNYICTLLFASRAEKNNANGGFFFRGTKSEINKSLAFGIFRRIIGMGIIKKDRTNLFFCRPKKLAMTR